MKSNYVFDFTPEQIRHIHWKNLSPVIERRTTCDNGHCVTIARHKDGRFTVEQDAPVM